MSFCANGFAPSEDGKGLLFPCELSEPKGDGLLPPFLNGFEPPLGKEGGLLFGGAAGVGGLFGNPFSSNPLEGVLGAAGVGIAGAGAAGATGNGFEIGGAAGAGVGMSEGAGAAGVTGKFANIFETGGLPNGLAAGAAAWLFFCSSKARRFFS